MKDLMAGIDLHSNNIMVGIVDGTGRRVAHQKLPCELERVLEFLKPYRKRLQGLAVESTYNWYWLVDGLQAAKYPAVLANPAGIKQYSAPGACRRQERRVFSGRTAAVEHSAHRLRV